MAPFRPLAGTAQAGTGAALSARLTHSLQGLEETMTALPGSVRILRISAGASDL